MSDIKQYQVKPGHKFQADDFNPHDRGSFEKKEEAVEETKRFIHEIDQIQERLYAEKKHSLLIVLQAIDTGGKDGTIRHVMKGINPEGCRVSSFKEPTPEELAHDFLWRIHQHVPAKGNIGIFNRSHYEDVLVTRVHGSITDEEAEKRFREINDFEKMLHRNGTTILKFYLAISKEEQKKRFQSRLDDPHKRWKFSMGDLKERRHWDLYPKAYSDAISATSTKHAPWYPIPADHKWYRNYLVAKIIVATLKDLDPQFPADPEGIDFKTVKIPD
jgi:PPK2 family polyphosphate:nucleotide phosphotransferase